MSNSNFTVAQETADEWKNRFRMLTASVPVGIAVNNLDADFSKIYANKGYYDVLGFTEEEFLERFPKGGLEAFHPDDREIVRQMAMHELRENNFVSVRTRVVHKTKGYIWAQYTGRLAPDSTGKPVVFISMTDISELMSLNENLEKEHNFNNLIASLTADAFFDCDIPAGIIRYSKNFADRMGVPETVSDYPASMLARGIIAPDSVHLYENRFHKETSGIVEEELHFKLPDGSDVWYQYHYNIIHDDSGEPVRAIGKMHEITKQHAQIAELSEKARKDQLTGLFNKVTTESMIKETLMYSVEGIKHALIIVDVDNFKNVNDKLGHLYGDTVLKLLASGLKPLFRSDDVIGRVGGDEFFVFLKNYKSLDILYDKAKEIGKLFRRTCTENGNSVNISASLGISLYPEHGTDFDTLYRCADAALYTTKERGKDGLTIFAGQLTSGYKATRTEIDRSTHVFTLSTLVDALPSAVYVVDMDSYEILFENERARALTVGSSSERRCYAAYYAEGEACKGCPVAEVIDMAAGNTVVVENHKMGSKVRVDATPVEWTGVKRAWLISCTDISS